MIVLDASIVITALPEIHTGSVVCLLLALTVVVGVMWRPAVAALHEPVAS